MVSTLLLKNMTLLDRTGNPPQDRCILVIQNGRIISLGDEVHWSARPEDEVTTLDLTGRYVLPGLIDCHVHLAGNGAPDSRLQGDAGWATLYQDPYVIEMMAQRGIFLVPTLKAGFDVLQGERPGVPRWIQEKLKYVQDDAMQSVQAALKGGVPLAMGTDAATPYNFHGDNAMELVWMVEAGLSPMQAIVSATSNAARALGWESWLGTLEPGKVADLLVVTKNPLENIAVLADQRTIEFVMKEGQIVARQPYASEQEVPEAMLAGAWICCGLPS